MAAGERGLRARGRSRRGRHRQRERPPTAAAGDAARAPGPLRAGRAFQVHDGRRAGTAFPAGRPRDGSGAMTRVQVWRGDETGGKLRLYDVEVNEGEVVLDIVHRLQATQAPDLAVRWNCKAGKCGSCSAEINGRPRLMCLTRMSTFAEDDVITVTPLRTFPVIRDLVTDVSYNYDKA